MNHVEIMAALKGGLIVSCQALPEEPLHSAFIMGRMALAAQVGGAVGIRCNSVVDVQEIRNQVALPIIGLIKQVYADSAVYITPTPTEVDALIHSPADIIALDATVRKRPGYVVTHDLIARIHAAGKLAMADISTLEEGLAAVKDGADIVSTTMSGYTPYSPALPGPDLGLIAALVQRVSVPVFAEGRIKTPEDLAACFAAGAYAVVVGGAITRPQHITADFVRAIPHPAHPSTEAEA